MITGLLCERWGFFDGEFGWLMTGWRVFEIFYARIDIPVSLIIPVIYASARKNSLSSGRTATAPARKSIQNFIKFSAAMVDL